MAKFNTLCKSGDITSVRILLVSKARPQHGVGVKYTVLGNNVSRTIMPLVSMSGDLTPDSKVKVLSHLSDVHPSLYSLLAQAYEYTERWAKGEVVNIEDFECMSTIGDLHVYRTDEIVGEPNRVIQ